MMHSTLLLEDIPFFRKLYIVFSHSSAIKRYKCLLINRYYKRIYNLNKSIRSVKFKLNYNRDIDIIKQNKIIFNKIDYAFIVK